VPKTARRPLGGWTLIFHQEELKTFCGARHQTNELARTGSVPPNQVRLCYGLRDRLLPAPEGKKSWRNPLFYSSMCWGWRAGGWRVLYSRWEPNRADRAEIARRRSREAGGERSHALEQLGGKELAIQSFTPTPSDRVENVQTVLGVANAKTVKLEPQSNTGWPSYSRDVTWRHENNSCYH